MRIIIAGGRDFSDYTLLVNKVDKILSAQKNIEIVSGGARGADKLGEVYANERGYSLSTFPANWDLHGRSAGYIRNAEMAEYADALIVFWDGKSKGTKHMIDIAKKNELLIRIINY